MTGEDLLGRLMCMTPEQRKYRLLTYDDKGDYAPILDHRVHNPDYGINGDQRAYIVLERGN